MSDSSSDQKKIADALQRRRHVFVRDLVIDAFIGVWRHEHGRTQRIRINLDLAVQENLSNERDELADVVCYQEVIDRVRKIVRAEHVKLVETLAERIATTCLEDKRVITVRVRVEKLEAVPDTASVGIEIERQQPGHLISE